MAALNRAALEAYGGDEDSADIVDAEVVEDEPDVSMSSKPPAHIAKALRDLL